MRYILVIVAAAFIVSCGAESEPAYRHKLDNWTERLSYNALNYQQDSALNDAMLLAAEIESTNPPATYASTHKHLVIGIGYYTDAIKAVKLGQDRKAIGLLYAFRLELDAAKKALPNGK